MCSHSDRTTGRSAERRSGAQIIPIGIRGSEKVLPPKTWNFFLDQKVDIHIGKPMDASAYIPENKDELIEVVRRE